jgi:hypothetical protein
MLTTTDLTLARDVGGALLLSFAFWILAGYGLLRFVRFGVCSVCGAVVSVWALNLLLGFLPGWVTLLLLGQSVVGGSSLARDLLFVGRILRAPDDESRRVLMARSQMAWFAFILAGTFALGLLGLVWGLDRPLGITLAAGQLALLLAVLSASFVLWVLVFFATQRLWGVGFCQVCAAVSSVWVANLLFGFLPAWATVFLLGQSVAGGAAMLRDLAARRLNLDDLPYTKKRLAKQGSYFAFLVTGTVVAVLLARAAVAVGTL